jgi:Ig-like domain CHU_C associated/SprB repeat
MKINNLLIILLLVICNNIFAQQAPTFIQNLGLETPIVCFGTEAKALAKVNNANFYQFQKKNLTTQLWQNIAGATGNPTTTNGDIRHSEYDVQTLQVIRVCVANTTDTIYSSELNINAQRPIFNFQPIDLIECNGSNTEFKLSASGNGTLVFQWLSSTDGNTFLPVAASTKYAGVTTPNLQVKNLINGDHLTYYRCIVKDANACEHYSDIAKLSVNQLSTAPLPTTTTKFCEGDTAKFTATGLVGNVVSYQWALRTAPSTAYVNLTNSQRFTGVNLTELKVNGILTTENAYRVTVNFAKTSQSASGTLVNSTCVKTATRTSYIINARPVKPAALPDVYRCGAGIIKDTINVAGNYFWYGDSLRAALVSNSPYFVSQVINTDTVFYVSQKDANSCESFKRSFNARINPLPIATLSQYYDICPIDLSFNLAINNVSSGGDKFSLKPGNLPLPSFLNISNQPLLLANTIVLPNSKASGNYNFVFNVKNSITQCVSADKVIDLKIKKATQISLQPNSATICEENPLQLLVNATAEAPISYQWYKNNVVLSGKTDSLLQFNAVNITDSGEYYLKVNGQCGVLHSENAQVNVLPKTQILIQPSSKIVCQSGTTIFFVSATGSGILHYQWYLNNNIIGTDSAGLKLINVPLSYDNAIIKCKVTSDCLPGIFTDNKILRVDDLPNAPIANALQGFCKATGNQTLTVTTLAKHSLTWFNNNLVQIPNPIINTAQVDTLSFWVSQKDSNNCESPKTQIRVEIGSPIALDLVSDVPALCASGNFNKNAILNANITHETNENWPINFKLFKNNIFVEANSDGDFTINNAAKYTVKVEKGFCTNKDSVEINSINPELNILPTANNKTVCLNNPATLSASGSFSGGFFAWWDNPFESINIFEGNVFVTPVITEAKTYFVSYLKKTGDLFCESPRKTVTVSLKPALLISAIVTNVSCADSLNGKIVVTVTNGQAPFVFKINNTITNSTGIFTGLLPNNYNLKVTDNEGCTFDTLLVVMANNNLRFTQNPQNIQRCKGNLANFIIVAEGQTEIVWQKKLPGNVSFEDIAASNLSNLRVDNIGSTANPHLTIYRAKIINSTCTLFSTEATLFVNSVSGIIPNQAICQGNAFQISLNPSLQIIGNVLNYQWQYRAGTSGTWLDLGGQTSSNLNLLNVSNAQAGYYRNKLVFDNTAGNTCIINSSTNGSRLTIDVPQIPTISLDTTICRGQSVSLTASTCAGTYNWSNGQAGSVITVNPLVTTTYLVSCHVGSCTTSAIDSVTVRVIDTQTSPPILTINKLSFCVGDSIKLLASNCLGVVHWSNGLIGSTLNRVASTSFTISAYCQTANCTSAPSAVLNINVAVPLESGQISNNTTINCAGYNPGTITSLIDPNGGKNPVIQWQKSENCESPSIVWTNIVGANSVTFNPSTLNVTTCFRRSVSDSCLNTVFSNVTKYQINPDPSITLASQNPEICFGQNTLLIARILGGVEPCTIQWQKNESSSSQSSSLWQNVFSNSDTVTFSPDSYSAVKTMYFRAKIDCQSSSCNLATSDVLSIIVLPRAVVNVFFSDSTICVGNVITLKSTDCLGQIKWNNNATTANINVSPTTNSIYTVTCKTQCDSVSKSINITVLAGTILPTSTTPITILEPNILQFSAVGQNLKWYSNAIGGVALTIAPSHTSPGIYNYWVSQTMANCESQRLQITASLLPQLSIRTQPLNQINCKGNQVTFAVSAIGSGTLTYKWQRKKPTETFFSDLNGSDLSIDDLDTPNLKVKAVGNDYNPNLTAYKCLVSDSVSTIISSVAILNVNAVNGSLDNQKLCIGDNFNTFYGLPSQTTGEVISIQWQSRFGTGQPWEDLTDEGTLSGSSTPNLRITALNSSNQKQYRCSVNFRKGTSFCIENSDLMTLKISDKPITPSSKSFEYCQKDKAPKLELYPPDDLDVLWYNEPIGGIKYTTQPKIETANAGDFVLFYSLQNASDCESSRVPISIKIHNQPALPINTTPALATDDASLKFTAIGENLKWYTSKTGKTFETINPEYFKKGKYDNYVSQTNQFDCESERLYILAELQEAFGITEQPKDQTNCDGNTVTFSFKIKGKTTYSLQWQIKKPKTAMFINIPQETSLSIKIPDAGDINYPNLSQFRCLINNGGIESYTDIVTLKVNQLADNYEDIIVCEGQKISKEILKTTITGDVSKIEWQKKSGSLYNTNFTFENPESFHLLQISDSSQYRLKVSFFTSGASVCVRNSNVFALKIVKKPARFDLNKIEICQFETVNNIKKKLPLNSFLFQNILDSTNIINDINTKLAGEKIYYLNQENTFGCKNDKTKLAILVNSSPKLTLIDSVYNICLYDKTSQKINIQNHPTFWYNTKLDDDPTESSLVIDTNHEGEYQRFVAISDSTGCFSDRKSVKFKINPCFMGQEPQNCKTLINSLGSTNSWIDFYDTQAQIIASVNSNGQKINDLQLKTSISLNNHIKDINGTLFYPRHYHLSAGKALLKKINVRFYLNNQEINNYLIATNNNEESTSTVIIRYSGIQQDCEILNNDLNNNYWLIKYGRWTKIENSNFSFIEFETDKYGEFIIWQSQIPNSKLIIKDKNLEIKHDNIITKGNYLIQKSKDNNLFFDLKSMSIEDNLFIFKDLKPFKNKNYYGLIYDFGNQIKYNINKIEVSNSEEKSICYVFENPTYSHTNFKFYMPDINKSSIILSDILGKIYALNTTLDQQDYVDIKVKTYIPSGIYFISAFSNSDQKCSAKMIIK